MAGRETAGLTVQRQGPGQSLPSQMGKQTCGLEIGIRSTSVF